MSDVSAYSKSADSMVFKDSKCLSVKNLYNYHSAEHDGRQSERLESWPINGELTIDLPLCDSIIQVCCLLHNFDRERDGFKIEDTLLVQGLYEWSRDSRLPTKKATRFRDKFYDYFLTVPWQMDRIQIIIKLLSYSFYLKDTYIQTDGKQPSEK